ncbi:hypothetical protein FYJ44_14200 [Desulfovibrio sp. PG-178-WT-4]|uniref:Uncharacterized protein n=1 Tax=Desulfovibrio porci TaxID=2605782 RepID=A0A6L5XPI4_9BACT|nr:hypothetical protein [Desulfovibrio porci]MDY3808757.1 hypothetical protein [Desulfovibrio porci]MSS29147.1 hypothetical protein [Desulfovibrio porci]
MRFNLAVPDGATVAFALTHGRVAERFNAAVLKTVEGVSRLPKDLYKITSKYAELARFFEMLIRRIFR